MCSKTSTFKKRKRVVDSLMHVGESSKVSSSVSDCESNTCCVIEKTLEASFNNNSSMESDNLCVVINEDCDYLSSNEDEGLEIKIKDCLVDWTKTYRSTIPVSCVDDLLSGLHNLGLYSLPKCSKTLLQTPTNLVFKDVGSGQYYHFGLINGLKFIIHQIELLNISLNSSTIMLTINIDGIKVFKSNT